MLIRVMAAGFGGAGFGFFNYQHHAEDALVAVEIVVFIHFTLAQVFSEHFVGQPHLVHFHNTAFGESGFPEVVHKNINLFGPCNASGESGRLFPEPVRDIFKDYKV